MRTGASRRFSFRSWQLSSITYGVLDGQVPLVVVPGGPGIAHNVVEPLLEWGPATRPLVYYDPTGAGDSDRPTGVTWDYELFVDELAALIDSLAVPRVHLFGASFGGLVSLGYALRQPGTIASLVVSGTSSSWFDQRTAIRAQIEGMEPALRDALLGKLGSTAYVNAYYQWVARYLCRVPLPRELRDIMPRSNLEAMRALKGPDPIGFSGSLERFDITDRLPEIRVPVLLTCGAHDAIYPAIIDRMKQLLPDARSIVFGASAHMPYYEEPARFASAMFSFLDEIDRR